jgi:hypothetical protein
LDFKIHWKPLTKLNSSAWNSSCITLFWDLKVLRILRLGVDANHVVGTWRCSDLELLAGFPGGAQHLTQNTTQETTCCFDFKLLKNFFFFSPQQWTKRVTELLPW